MARPPKKPTLWFVKQGGKVYGPFDSARLKKLADANKIRRDSEVTKQLPGPWAKAERVRGLFNDEDSAQSDNEGLTVRSGVEGKPSGAFARLLRRPSSPVELPKRPGGDARWYYREIGRDDEDAKGPHTTAEMDRLVDKGTVRASTLVLRAGDSRWETAFSAGLFLDDPQEDGADSQLGHGDSPVRRRAGQPTGEPSTQREKNNEPEKVLWTAKPSHHANYFAYTLCFLASPLILPIVWGLRRFVERDCTRYQITSRRVQIKRGTDHTKRQDILLENIRDARLACPPSLQTTSLCNVELIGANVRRPLAGRGQSRFSRSGAPDHQLPTGREQCAPYPTSAITSRSSSDMSRSK